MLLFVAFVVVVVILSVVAGATAGLAAAAARQGASRPRATVLLNEIISAFESWRQNSGKILRTSPSSQVHPAAAAETSPERSPFCCPDTEMSCLKAVEAAEELSSGSVSWVVIQ